MNPQSIKQIDTKFINFYYRITHTDVADPFEQRRGRLMSMYLLMSGVILLHITIANIFFMKADTAAYKEYIYQEIFTGCILYLLWMLNRKGYTLWIAHIFINFAILTPILVYTCLLYTSRCV